MKLLTFRDNDQLRLGVKLEQGILDVSLAASALSFTGVPNTLEEFIFMGQHSNLILQKLIQLVDTQDIKEVILPENTLVFGPCLPYGRKIICVGLNYKRHAVESKMAVPEVPLLFSKFDNTLSGHQEDIYLPIGSLQVDYEAELVAVIGKRAKHVSIEDSLSHVFGYCNVNDLSARDLQFKTSQWLLGKSCDGFSPVGPYLVTSDEVVNPNNLQIKCFVNGEIRQNSNTSDMVFSIEHIVSYISRYMTLEPGDAILTGTPEGVVLGKPAVDQVWLQDSDRVTIEIEKLGTLTNTLRRK